MTVSISGNGLMKRGVEGGGGLRDWFDDWRCYVPEQTVGTGTSQQQCVSETDLRRQLYVLPH